MPHLIVIYGPPLSGKSSLARAVADALDDKTAVVSTDAMLDDAIRVHDRDVYAELEMVHMQAKLLVANYLKNRYNVVLEGAFSYERGGEIHQHEQEIDQLLGLMRNLAWSPLLVRLGVAEDTLRRRADTGSPLRDVASAMRIDAAYRQRAGKQALALATDRTPIEDLVAAVMDRLAADS